MKRPWNQQLSWVMAYPIRHANSVLPMRNSSLQAGHGEGLHWSGSIFFTRQSRNAWCAERRNISVDICTLICFGLKEHQYILANECCFRQRYIDEPSHELTRQCDAHSARTSVLSSFTSHPFAESVVLGLS